MSPLPCLLPFTSSSISFQLPPLLSPPLPTTPLFSTLPPRLAPPLVPLQVTFCSSLPRPTGATGIGSKHGNTARQGTGNLLAYEEAAGSVMVQVRLALQWSCESDKMFAMSIYGHVQLILCCNEVHNTYSLFAIFCRKVVPLEDELVWEHRKLLLTSIATSRLKG